MKHFFKTLFFKLLMSLPLIGSGKPATSPTHHLDGKWIIELTNNDIGLVRTVMEFKTDSNSFTAFTRKNADRDILGWGVSTLARAFSNDFKEGRLLRIINGRIVENKDSIILTGIFTSPLGNYYFNSTVKGNTITAVLTTKNHDVYGRMRGIKDDVQIPFENYPGIFEEAISVTKQKIYDTELTKNKKWKKFERKMNSVSPHIRDDLEMVFAFFYYSGKLPFSHYALMKIAPGPTTQHAVDTGHFVFLKALSPKTAYMKISSFGGTAREMDSIFDLVNRNGYNNLIVDMRGNPGGSVEAGMQFAKNIVDTIVYGGIFLTQKWFNVHPQPPALHDYTKFEHFTEANFDLIINGIHAREGLCLKVTPRQTVFRGKIFILTDKNTASTCEPIIYALKQNKLATIVGETTAGAMLNGETFGLTSGFKIIIPTATYYTIDGHTIDQRGVNPDFETKPKDALDYVLNNLIEK